MIGDIKYLKYLTQIVTAEIIAVRKTIFGDVYTLRIKYKNGGSILVNRAKWRTW